MKLSGIILLVKRIINILLWEGVEGQEISKNRKSLNQGANLQKNKTKD